MSRPSSTSE